MQKLFLFESTTSDSPSSCASGPKTGLISGRGKTPTRRRESTAKVTTAPFVFQPDCYFILVLHGTTLLFISSCKSSGKISTILAGCKVFTTTTTTTTTTLQQVGRRKQKGEAEEGSSLPLLPFPAPGTSGLLAFLPPRNGESSNFSHKLPSP